MVRSASRSLFPRVRASNKLSLAYDGCQRVVGQVHVVLFPQVQHFDCIRQALALRVFRQPRHFRQLPPCVRRVIVNVRADDVS